MLSHYSLTGHVLLKHHLFLKSVLNCLKLFHFGFILFVNEGTHLLKGCLQLRQRLLVIGYLLIVPLLLLFEFLHLEQIRTVLPHVTHANFEINLQVFDLVGVFQISFSLINYVRELVELYLKLMDECLFLVVGAVTARI